MKFKRGDRIIYTKEGNSFHLKTGVVLSVDIWDSVIYFDKEYVATNEEVTFDESRVFRLSNNFIELEVDYDQEPTRNKVFKNQIKKTDED